MAATDAQLTILTPTENQREVLEKVGFVFENNAGTTTKSAYFHHAGSLLRFVSRRSPARVTPSFLVQDWRARGGSTITLRG
ncbi:MAG: hypothetical protein H7240_01435 [Glaciimonas sp.]|nr:hypothetical protein [Glaciimonas sp.]